MDSAAIRSIAEQARSHLERIVKHLLPDGRRQGREYLAINPRRADTKPGSFSINLDSGAWADFATGDKGGDAVSLMAYLDGGNQGKAAERLAALVGITGKDASASPKAAPSSAKKTWTPITPLPDNAPPPPAAHPKHGLPSATWTYHDASGKPICHVCRFETPGGKSFAPLTYCESTGGQRAWRWQGLPEPRPLYNSNLLQNYPEAVVVVCEGEKAADAAAVLFPTPDYVTVTPMNGAKSPAKSDWTPLAHRTVWLWPDHDEAGRGFANEVYKLLRAAQSNEPPEDRGAIQEIRLDFFKRLPDGTERELPPKWDAADAVVDGFTADHINNVFLSDPANLLQPKQEADAAAAAFSEQEAAAEHERQSRQEANGFTVIERQKGKRNGVYFQGEDDDSPRWICDPLHVTAQCRDDNGRSWGRLLEFKDPEGAAHAWTMPMRVLAGDGTALREELLDQGLAIAPGRRARELLTTYLQTARPATFARCVERTGWHLGAFVLPDEVIGASAVERVLFQTSDPTATPYAQAGSLDDWRQSVAALCAGNTRLILAVSAAFASMLLTITGKENGGVHFRGRSSEGKTTILRAAASVFGPGRDFVENWRATDNGLEAVAAAHNDTLLILDEMAQVDARIVGDIAYMLANGQGKSRSNRQGGARPRKQWRLLFLSSGEISLADHMRQASKRAHAGQETRLIDVPADTGRHGAFEQLHGYPTGGEFAQALSAATMRAYGVPARTFLRALTAVPLEQIEAQAHALIKDFVSGHVPRGASGQVTRVAERFALIAAGGELATALGITGWTAGEAIWGAKACFDAVIAARGGHGPKEEAVALEQVRLFFQQHGESRFTPLDGDSHRDTINRAGYCKATDEGMEFLVFPEIFKAEICKGLDARYVARLLADRGLLYTEASGKTVTVHKVYGQPTRLYRFKPGILGESGNAN